MHTRTETAPRSSDPSARNIPRALALMVALAIGVLGLDLVVKRLAVDRVAGQPVTFEPGAANPAAHIPPHEPIVVIPHVLSLTLTVNDGAVFGIGPGSRTRLIIIGVVAMALISWISWRARRGGWMLQTGMSLVLAGAAGNLYDRIAFGFVRDMFLLFPDSHLPFGWSWPNGHRGWFPWIFNIADVALDFGVVLLLIVLFRSKPSPTGSPHASLTSGTDDS